jgi:hypothetical protein
MASVMAVSLPPRPARAAHTPRHFRTRPNSGSELSATDRFQTANRHAHSSRLASCLACAPQVRYINTAGEYKVLRPNHRVKPGRWPQGMGGSVRVRGQGKVVLTFDNRCGACSRPQPVRRASASPPLDCARGVCACARRMQSSTPMPDQQACALFSRAVRGGAVTRGSRARRCVTRRTCGRRGAELRRTPISTAPLRDRHSALRGRTTIEPRCTCVSARVVFAFAVLRGTGGGGAWCVAGCGCTQRCQQLVLALAVASGERRWCCSVAAICIMGDG